jgi:SpoIID/LytB domain protein
LKKYLGNVDESGKYFRWNLKISQSELTKNINEKTRFFFTKINNLLPVKRGVSGRILELKVIGSDGSKDVELILKSEYEIRRVLHPRFLYSSAFIIKTENYDHVAPSNFILDGAGWGHGVGLCQMGALKMALEGKSANEILLHYFSSTEVKKIYD